MRVFLQLAYLLVGFVQFFAVWDGAEYLFEATSFLGKMLSFFLAAILTYVPLVGSAAGVYGATHVWDWSLLKALILFFWWVPFYAAVGFYFFIVDR